MSKKILFLLFFLFAPNFIFLEAATGIVQPVCSKTLSGQTVRKIPKFLERKVKKMRRSNFAGLEAYAYVMMFFLLMVLMAIGLILSLVFSWTIGAWIFGIIFGVQLLFCLIFLLNLL